LVEFKILKEWSMVFAEQHHTERVFPSITSR
jgi:hypothetical protein